MDLQFFEFQGHEGNILGWNSRLNVMFVIQKMSRKPPSFGVSALRSSMPVPK